jgi:hypothetical protein
MGVSFVSLVVIMASLGCFRVPGFQSSIGECRGVSGWEALC